MTVRLLVLASLLAPTAALAHPGGHEEEIRRPSTIIPETFGGVVSALRAGHASATTAMAGKITDAATHAQAMADLAAALPSKATSLSAEAQADVATRSAAVKKQAETVRTKAWTADPAAVKGALDAIALDLAALELLAK